MANLPIDDIEQMVGSRYALTVLAGKRARDLRDGAPRLVNTEECSPVLVALQEIQEGHVVADNLDLSSGIEEREALEHEAAVRALTMTPEPESAVETAGAEEIAQADVSEAADVAPAPSESPETQNETPVEPELTADPEPTSTVSETPEAGEE